MAQPFESGWASLVIYVPAISPMWYLERPTVFVLRAIHVNWTNRLGSMAQKLGVVLNAAKTPPFCLATFIFSNARIVKRHQWVQFLDKTLKDRQNETITMNTAPPEVANESPKRQASTGSASDLEPSNRDQNPLMRLVDAALAPSAQPNDPSSSSPTTNTSEVNRANTSMRTETTEKNNEEGEPQEGKSSLKEAKVIKGTVQDLVDRQEKKVTFAEYLMQCLNDEANHDVMQWMPCGTQFTITNHRKFTMERMPTLFKIRNMSSFVRKLTRWGFSRVHEKETGNSDIFKHPMFQKDKPDLCKKIRCVNRATQSKGSHFDGMTNLSESSMRHHDMHMVSPRRSMGHSNPYMSGRSPGSYSSRYQTPMGAHPRVSPEYEKEMIGGGQAAFRPRPPAAAQGYSPIGRSMSAAAEYELEQILLERQRARAAMYRDAPQPREVSPPSGMGGASERSMGSSLPPSSQAPSGEGRRGGDHLLSATTNSVVSAALETLQREGDYDLDMSPREAMLRAVLHKRQQQRQQRTVRPSGGYPPEAHGPPPRGHHPSVYYR